MSKKVLATNWRKASGAQRARFQEVFSTLLIRTYSAAFRNYNDEQIVVLSERQNHNRSRVEIKTKIKRKHAADVAVNYRFKNNNGTWKVYDINVDNVGLVSNFRSQFASSIRKHGLDKVIAKIDKQNKADMQ